MQTESKVSKQKSRIGILCMWHTTTTKSVVVTMVTIELMEQKVKDHRILRFPPKWAQNSTRQPSNVFFGNKLNSKPF